MKINEEHLVVPKTARYYTNSPAKKITSVNFVIHGYATLAKNFIEEFYFLDNENTLIVAPEGLSKFYSRDRPAASWMTKEDRLNEIKDYVYLLDEVYNDAVKRYDINSSKVNIVGFSQGVHTAVRWFIGSKYNFFNKLILCSSDFPADADFNLLRDKLSGDSKMFYVYGKKDAILGVTIYEYGLKILKDNQINFSEIHFEGGHRIDEKILKELLL